MKIKLLLFLLLGVFFFVACDDDDDDYYNPSNQAQTTFASRYPGSTNISWKYRDGYDVVDFRYNNYDREAWFERTGTWVMTVTDLERVSNLPGAVEANFTLGIYGSWDVERVVQIERAGYQVVYVIEVDGDDDLLLYYSSGGILLRVIEADDWDNSNYLPNELPTSINTYIEQNYPGAYVVEIERSGSYLNVDIIHNARKKEVRFNASNYNWIQTQYEVSYTELPGLVINTLESSQYRNYTIDKVQFYENPTSSYYVFDLRSGSQTATVTIDSLGNIL